MTGHQRYEQKKESIKSSEIRIENTTAKNEFLAVENIADIEGGKAWYSRFVNAYIQYRGRDSIQGLTPDQRWMQKTVIK
jgi:hypothetical protein